MLNAPDIEGGDGFNAIKEKGIYPLGLEVLEVSLVVLEPQFFRATITHFKGLVGLSRIDVLDGRNQLAQPNRVIRRIQDVFLGLESHKAFIFKLRVPILVSQNSTFGFKKRRGQKNLIKRKAKPSPKVFVGKFATTSIKEERPITPNMNDSHNPLANELVD